MSEIYCEKCKDTGEVNGNGCAECCEHHEGRMKKQKVTLLDHRKPLKEVMVFLNKIKEKSTPEQVTYSEYVAFVTLGIGIKKAHGKKRYEYYLKVIKNNAHILDSKD